MISCFVNFPSSNNTVTSKCWIFKLKKLLTSSLLLMGGESVCVTCVGTFNNKQIISFHIFFFLYICNVVLIFCAANICNILKMLYNISKVRIKVILSPIFW